MGSIIKMNAILKITFEAGMPRQLEVGKKYQFRLKGERVFQFYPTWVTLVHEIDNKWKYVGQAQITKQTIDAENHITSGEYLVTRVFPEDFVRMASFYESPEGESFFTEDDF